MVAFTRHTKSAEEVPNQGALSVGEQAHLLVDVSQEPSFDESVRLTAQLLDFPMAAISLLGSTEQVFKARFGLDIERTPIGDAFCAHTVREQGVFVVTDAAIDPRFAENPLVTGAPGLRAYAGVPLVMPSGEVLGALCVLDTKPREMSTASCETLRLLARQVTIQMQLEKLIARQAKDIIDLQLARSEMAYMAMHDPLTALLNRRGIFERLSEILAADMVDLRAHDATTTVLFIDLDGFKQLNDTHGHRCGDRALATIARRIKNAVPDSATAGRLGGDEFVVVLPEIEPAQALLLAESLLGIISRPMGRDDFAVRLTASIGIACADNHARPSELIICADRAMYRAKQAGGAKVAFGELSRR